MSSQDSFRSRMGLLHTWAGLVFSALLFAVFWTGTLSVFDKEIDSWMMPATRISIGEASALSVDQDIIPMLTARASGADSWSVVLPRERTPYLTLVSVATSEQGRSYWRENFHPATLASFGLSKRPNASNFLYPFHHNLTMHSTPVGAWLIGIASMGMLCLVISGVVVHRKIFAEFFTLRLLRRFGRANLDIHNLGGVLLLPFVLVITLSGLMVAHLVYFPQATAVGAERTERSAGEGRGGQAASSERRFMAEGLGRAGVREAAGQPAEMASIDQMVAAAERDWGQGSVHFVRISHPQDAKGIVVLRQDSQDTVTRQIGNRRFELASGAQLDAFEASRTVNVWNFIGGLHYLQFRHWLLRWLYFIGGLGACVVIATGLMHWTQARNKGRRAGRLNVALFNGLSIATVTGLVAATGAFLLSNRLVDGFGWLAVVGGARAEIGAFYGVWALCAVHAAFRVLQHRQHGYLLAWREQCWAIAGLAAAAVLMNWVTTGDHLLKTLVLNPYWPVAATDLVLLATAALALYAAQRLNLSARNAGRELWLSPDHSTKERK